MVSDNFRGPLFMMSGMLIFSLQDVLNRQLSDEGSLVQVLTMRGILKASVISIFGMVIIVSSSIFIFFQRRGVEETICTKDKLENISLTLAYWATKRDLNYSRCFAKRME